MSTQSLKTELNIERFSVLKLLFITVLVSVLPQWAQAETRIVTNETELRDALAEFAINDSTDTIDLAGSTLTLSDTVEYTVFDSRSINFRNGTIRRDIGSPSFRLLTIRYDKTTPSPSRSIFIDLTFENGQHGVASGLPDENGGGAIYTEIELSLFRTTFDSNKVIGDGNGGAIYSTAESLNFDRATLTNNSVTGTGFGGAVFAVSRLSFLRSSAINNSIDNGGAGGALANTGLAIGGGRSLSVSASLFQNNSAGEGGAIYTLGDGNAWIYTSGLISNRADTLGGAVWSSNSGGLVVTKSTLYGNVATENGGAIYMHADTAVSIDSSTITGNTASNTGGGIYYSASASILLDNTIIVNNGTNCAQENVAGPATVTSVNRVLIDDVSCGSDAEFQAVSDLTSLFTTGIAADNGRAERLDFNFPTITVALAVGSPAIDAGNCPTYPDRDPEDRLIFDQRFFEYVGNCDIGAYEYLPAADSDEDGIPDDVDNCEAIPNFDQADLDDDSLGDVCDDDIDNDSALNTDDNCPTTINADQGDIDGDGLGDACDTTDDRLDTDSDGVVDAEDNCPLDSNSLQLDVNQNGVGDACEVTVDINPAIDAAAVDLDAIISTADRNTARVLRRAARNLDRALRGSNWTSDNNLRENRARNFFNNISSALNNIEIIADSRNTGQALQAQLDAITEQLLINARQLATDKIAEAISADGRTFLIGRAERELLRGDINQGVDFLRGAATDYGDAYRLASFAF